MKKQNSIQINNLDKIGITASLICAVHCSVLPILIVILPSVGLSLLITETFEWIFLIFSFMLAFLSMCFGYNKHKSLKAIIPLSVGSTIILISKLYLHHHQNVLSFDIYNVLLVFGGLLLMLSHWINSYLCNHCTKCEKK